jgi:hypothetical protein
MTSGKRTRWLGMKANECPVERSVGNMRAHRKVNEILFAKR